tara:strand:+ start:1046 stop:1321 length:276 start_codon:yes stop_codon:yes gene_type:complete
MVFTGVRVPLITILLHQVTLKYLATGGVEVLPCLVPIVYVGLIVGMFQLMVNCKILKLVEHIGTKKMIVIGQTVLSSTSEDSMFKCKEDFS